MEATRRALDLSGPGDVVVLCVDSHAAVWSEIQSRSHLAQAGSRDDSATGDPDLQTPLPFD
jgi:cyanophycin synthetase